jgi:hypothetical protein
MVHAATIKVNTLGSEAHSAELQFITPQRAQDSPYLLDRIV